MAPAKPVRCASKPVDKDKFDITATGKLHVQASVKDKVRKWNTTGGGVIKADDGVVGVSDKEDVGTAPKAASASKEAKSSSKTSSSAKQTTEEDTQGSDDTTEERQDDEDSVVVVVEVEEEEEDVVVVEEEGEGDDVEKPRPRRKTAGDARIVDWPSTPVRKRISPRLPATDPAHVQRRPRPNRLDQEIKRASAPKKRVVSDGAWRKHRVRPKSPQGPSTPQKTRAAAQLGWVRPPLLPRKDPNEEPPKPKQVDLPQMKVFTGKLRKPIFHSFVPAGKPPRESPPKEEDVEHLDPKRTPSNKRRASRRVSLTSDSSSDDDETEVTTPPRRKSSHLQVRERRSATLTGSGSRSRRESRSPGSPEDILIPRMDRASQKHTGSPRSPSQPRTLDRRSEDSREHRRGASLGSGLDSSYRQAGAKRRDISGDPEDSVPRRSSYYPPREERRQPSYNAGDTVPPLDEADILQTPIIRPAHVEDWLNRTPDPFVSPSDGSRKSSKGSRRVFSFESGETESTMATSISDPSGHKLEDRGKSRESRNKSVGSKHALNPDAEVGCASITPSPTLKRSGARRNHISPRERTKSPEVRHNAESDVTSSVLTPSVLTSSTVTSSFVSSVDTASDMTPSQPPMTPLPLRRQFPSTGKPLSTIVSVETLNANTHQSPESVAEFSDVTERPEVNDENNSPKLNKGGSHNRTPTAAIKVRPSNQQMESASGSPRRSKSLVSTSSIRSHRSRLATATVSDLMAELVGDEDVYMPELRTLTGGVIPVLFRCVLSKSEAAVAAGLFSKFAVGGDSDATRAIHEMGVALERLKRHHHRMPKEDVSEFMAWAKSALRIYTEYVRTWRLGFQDVVVNLVPADESSVVSGKDLEGGSLANGLPRNDEGYVVNAEGEMVDVAFLLKRPLVRLKFLTKSIKGINFLQPSDESANMLQKYEGLMEDARKKVNSEKARLEDQSAALVDTTRARDPKSLVALAGVKVDPNRCVRARDFFDMHLIHSSGQQVLSRVELLLRDDPQDKGKGGDVLLCQTDDRGRWLFLPPILLKHISCRLGSAENELVVMIRGVQSRGQEWQELFSLCTTEHEVATEWLQMLGTNPVPPNFTRETIVKETAPPRPPSSRGSSMLSGSMVTGSTISGSTRPDSPFAHDVPIGERAGPNAMAWGEETPDRTPLHSRDISPNTDMSSDMSRDNQKSSAKYSTPPLEREAGRKGSSSKELRGGSGGGSFPRDLNEAMKMAGDGSPTGRRVSAKRHQVLPVSPTPRSENGLSASGSEEGRLGSSNRKGLAPARDHRTSRDNPRVPVRNTYTVWMPSSDAENSDEEDDIGTHFSGSSSQFSELNRRSSAAPTKGPLIPPRRPSGELRGGAEHTNRASLENSSSRTINATHRARYAGHTRSSSTPQTTTSTNNYHTESHSADMRPKRPKEIRHSWLESLPEPERDPDIPPPPPPHTSPLPPPNDVSNVPKLNATIQNTKRRSSSPLKHEYQPSSASESLSDGYNFESDSNSDSFSDEVYGNELTEARLSTLAEEEETRTDLITPSQSASQAPCQDVNPMESFCYTAIATVFWWDLPKGQFHNVHQFGQKCLIEIKSNGISAYETIPDERAPGGFQKKLLSMPLLSIALDIDKSVAEGKMANVDLMFSGRFRGESHLSRQLLSLKGESIIFSVRLDNRADRNRLFVAIHDVWKYCRAMRYQAARLPPVMTGTQSYEQQQDELARKQAKPGRFKGIFGRGSKGSKSFRKTNTRSGSTVGNTDASYRTDSSLKKGFRMVKNAFGKGKIDIEKSTLISKSQGGPYPAASSSPEDAFFKTIDTSKENPIRNSFWCRVYSIANSEKRSMGTAVLYVLSPPTLNGEIVNINGPAGRHDGEAVRIALSTPTYIIEDCVLPPSAFTHVHKGINIQVYKDKDGGNITATGGVGSAKTHTYFIKFGTESKRDFAYQILTGCWGLGPKY